MLPPEPAPQAVTATVRANTLGTFFEGYGQPPQPNLNALDFGYPQQMTLGGLGGQAQVLLAHT